MKWSEGLRFHTRVTVLTMATAMVALVLVTTSFVAYDVVSLRRLIVDRLATDAEQIGTFSVAAIVFDSPTEAETALAVLEHQPMVTAACIYVEDGTVFATYTKAAVPQSFPEIEELSHRFVGDHVEIFSAIRSDDQRVGTIYIRRELTDVDEHVYRVIGLAVAVLLASLAITMLIAARFQRHLTRPIEQLSQTIEAVGAGDLEAKVSITRRDEIGQLAETFNKMTDRLKQTTVSRDDLAHLNEELAQFNRMAVGRENRMIELKREVNSLAEAAGQSPPYDLSFTEEPAQVGGDGHDG